tara:strand:+ start:101 stop:424 length:324 start_codon:yes stop_codon:yes gene_type:complete
MLHSSDKYNGLVLYASKVDRPRPKNGRVGQLYSISFGLFYLSQSTISFIYKENINIDSMKQKKVKVPYEGYKLPPSAEQGGQFVDFKKIMERKPVKVVKRRIKKNAV